MDMTNPAPQSLRLAVIIAGSPVWAGILGSLLATTPPNRADFEPAMTRQEPFTEIRVVINRALTDTEVDRVCGCVSNALGKTLCGQGLTQPIVATETTDEGVNTLLTFDYDSRTSQRTDPHYGCAFQLAGMYVVFGTPVQATDFWGPGTKGNQAVQGIGQGTTVNFYVR